MKAQGIRRKLTGIAVAILIVCIAAFIGFRIYTASYYQADETVIASIKEETANALAFSDDNGMVFIPKDGEYLAVIVFYPGGKVEYTAYSGLMYLLADKGYICLLPKMPDNLAFLKTDAVESMVNNHPEDASMVSHLDWYLAGHSLGGVAASSYLSGNKDDYRGIILCASYTTEDFSASDIRLLSVYGSDDGVLNMKSYEDSKSKWPQDSSEYVINGGIHSYFGCYGIQKGDGIPTITNEEQLQIAADEIDA